MRALAPWEAVVVGALVVASGCAPRRLSCDGTQGCVVGATCLAGQCRLPEDGGPGAPPPLAKTRRLLLWPAAIALIARGTGAAGVLPTSVTLGRDGDGPRAVLLRFDVPPGVQVIEANLLVDRDDGDPDGAGVGLHAERVTGGWTPSEVTWRDGPPLEDVHAPSVVVRQGSPSTLRLPATAVFLASNERRGEPPPEGLAILADATSRDGVAITLAPTVRADDADRSGAGTRYAPREPRLELYVK